MPPPTLLAFDTSTEVMSVALLRDGSVTGVDGEGGAQASLHLIPRVMTLLREAGCVLAQVDAVAFGQGPGAFTGLRTACAVAQGLAFGAGKPVLPLDSLLIAAEDARGQRPEVAADLWVAMDARMDEVYAARYGWSGDRWQVLQAPALFTLEALAERWKAEPPLAVAGSAMGAFGDRLPLGRAVALPAAASRAHALASLALQAWMQGRAVEATQAQPVYLRDKVALTTAERMAAKASREAV
jgi:tRNA threonylcarbamoyladenosine biosynthesis protein TsaB